MQKNTVLWVVVLLLIAHSSFSQNKDSIKAVSHFSGSIGITQNGIALVPTFSLGRPAGIVMLSMGKKRFSFEPEFRFSLSGKPWSFLFWFRYQAVKANKFSLRIGAHPAINFRTQQVTIDGEVQDAIVTRRFLAAEIVPNYFINKDFSIGMYYLKGFGFDKGGPRSSHFLTLNANFSNIRLSEKYYMKFYPMVFFLKLDDETGFFAAPSVTLARKEFPLSVAALFNKELEKGITGAKDFVWNLTLTYSFGKNYIEK
ncbi:MAG: hypothetical protein ACT4OJ_06665 [Bacteroidota bacterium]